MNSYNPVMLERYISRLLRNARFRMITTPIFLAGIGIVIGAGFAYLAELYLVRDLLVYGIVGAVVGLLIGILAGLSAAARLREQASLALAILHIEQNTRPVEMDTPDFIPLSTAPEA
ncbi:MAG: hypothetical protein WCF08_03245 [Anaerolineaceae bacterium]